ncbi:hypothetical protein ACFYYR_05660 [Streptomyces sp. NPDC001922]|uniref:hypothetical protein n=1 Tax=Streptomyces sp. NPDC001922 TaxID=3364624 RepID=UPI0036864ED3
MSTSAATPAEPGAGGALVLPPERGRRVLGVCAVAVALMAALLLLEAVSILGAAALSKSPAVGFAEIVAAPGVAGYAALPVATGVLTLLVSLVPAWRQPELRIDAAGLTTVRGRRAGTVPWGDVEATGFTRGGGVLVLVLRAHAALPGGRELDRSRPVPYYALGVAVRGRLRRERRRRIRVAIEHFAPGRHAEEPLRRA